MVPFGRRSRVPVPSRLTFRSADAFYSTLGHETAHATSHASRLDRKLEGRFGSKAYAAEELIADICSGFLMADLGFAHGARPETAAYLASWLACLKTDSRAIFTAAAKAQAAADWMHAQQPGTQDDKPADDNGLAGSSADAPVEVPADSASADPRVAAVA
jgi:antirestriction protein ArdC